MYDQFITYTTVLVSYWWPWSLFLTEIILIQFLLAYVLNLVFVECNVYYILLYIFVIIFMMGLFLGLVQLEIFTAFLWLIECSVIFIALLLLFYTNSKGIVSNYDLGIFNKNFICFFVFIFSIFHFNSSEFIFNFELGYYYFLEIYYEAVNNTIMNDLFGFLLSFYIFCSVEFLFIGFLLLIGSVLCVCLFCVNRIIRSQTYNNFLLLYSFFSNLVSFFLIKKQNLINQSDSLSASKIFFKI